METPDLIAVCISALMAVFLVLAFLAFAMRLILIIFPEKQKEDSAVVAAIISTLNTILPAVKITKIEELK